MARHSPRVPRSVCGAEMVVRPAGHRVLLGNDVHALDRDGVDLHLGNDATARSLLGPRDMFNQVRFSLEVFPLGECPLAGSIPVSRRPRGFVWSAGRSLLWWQGLR